MPGGLSFQEAAALVGAIVRSGRRIVGFDLVEVAPDPEGGEWDGNVGARLLYKLVGWMLRVPSGLRRGRGQRTSPRFGAQAQAAPGSK